MAGLTPEASVSVPSLGSIMALLGSGASGPILMTLGRQPLRTQQLTERIPQFAPRTVYRYQQKLAQLGLVEREEKGGVPSAVFHRLSKRGRDLYGLVDRYASSALPRGHEGRVEDGAWTILALLGEMWDTGWIAELCREARSPTELAEETEGLTFHQANRRARRLCTHDLLCRCGGRERGTRYQLGDQARRGMSLVAGLARWRQRHLLPLSGAGLTVTETATVLQTSLPLLKLVEHVDTSIKLGIVGLAAQNGNTVTETLLVKVGHDGRVRCAGDAGGSADAWAAGTVNTWLAAMLNGNRGRMRVGGNLTLVDSCLRGLHQVPGGYGSVGPDLNAETTAVH